MFQSNSNWHRKRCFASLRRNATFADGDPLPLRLPYWRLAARRQKSAKAIRKDRRSLVLSALHRSVSMRTFADGLASSPRLSGTAFMVTAAEIRDRSAWSTAAAAWRFFDRRRITFKKRRRMPPRRARKGPNFPPIKGACGSIGRTCWRRSFARGASIAPAFLLSAAGLQNALAGCAESSASRP